MVAATTQKQFHRWTHKERERENEGEKVREKEREREREVVKMWQSDQDPTFSCFEAEIAESGFYEGGGQNQTSSLSRKIFLSTYLPT